jgi:hypothetical protein
MLPYFGGYPDLFWTNAMAPQPDLTHWMFGLPPSVAAQPEQPLGWTIPAGYPW